MINIVLAGCTGHMGRAVAAKAKTDKEVRITAGVDVNTDYPQNFPTCTEFFQIQAPCDVIIDFSSPAALGALLEYAEEKKIPLVLCATGYTPEQTASIEKVSKQIPIFKSGNMSLGINLLAELVRRACAFLGSEYDVEIVEKHHRRKIDAPSGTALLLADAAASALPYEPYYVYDRSTARKPRTGPEIGISSVRGGTIVGEHEVIFAGPGEVLKLSHSAASRDIFAAGAIKAAKFILQTKKTGLYDMSDMLES